MTAEYTAAEIALWFLNHVRSLSNDENEEYLTNLKLQKLLYYAQGASLALHDRPLFDDRIEHWTHGPVVPDVYRIYSKYGGSPIIFDEDYEEKIDSDTDALLVDVYDTFGCYSAWGLRNLTHGEDQLKNTSRNDEITQESIKKYFKEHYV